MIDGLEATARRAFDRLPLSVRRRVQYRRHVGRSLSLRNPKTFTEKVNWRIVNDRRDLLAWTCDKLAMKDYAEQAGVRVPRLVWSGNNASNLIEEWPADAPHRWVLKPKLRERRLPFRKWRSQAGPGASADGSLVRSASGELW